MIEVEVTWQGERHRFSLADGEHTVGRSSENAVCLPVTMVSKKHALLRVEGARLWVRDLGSTNGTEVNGRPIGAEPVEITPGMMASFAGAVMRRADSPVGPGPGAPLTMLTLTTTARATRSFHAKQGYSESGAERIMGLISGLFELLALGTGRRAVEQAACEFVARQTRADRVVLIGEKRGVDSELDIRARWTRGQDDPDAPLQLSGSIIRQVTQARESVLVSGTGGTGGAPGESFIRLNLRSAMAAPLFDNERVRGIIYVDTMQPDVEWEQADIEVLTATANAVAVKLRNLLLESELQMGAEIQRLMMPAQPSLEGYDVAARYIPARTIGGDLFDFINRNDGRAILLVADVTGKGLPAALLMANTQATMRAQTAAGGSVRERVARANGLICEATAPETFVTAFYAELDTATHRLSFCNAGHEHPYLFRADGTLERLATGGLTLGILPGFEFRDDATDLRPGDTLFVFTDGVTDATNDAQELFGAARLEQVLRANLGRGADAIAQAVVDAVAEHARGDDPFDDLTLLVLRRLQAPRP